MTLAHVNPGKVIPFPVIVRHYDVPVNPGAVLLFNAAGKKIPIVADNRAVHILEKSCPIETPIRIGTTTNPPDDPEEWASPGDWRGENNRSETCPI